MMFLKNSIDVVGQDGVSRTPSPPQGRGWVSCHDDSYPHLPDPPSPTSPPRGEGVKGVQQLLTKQQHTCRSIHPPLSAAEITARQRRRSGAPR